MTHEEFAKELFATFARRAEEEGINPNNENIGLILASMMAAHYVAMGRDPVTRTRLKRYVRSALYMADQTR